MSDFEVEIVFALPERQLLETVLVTAGETVLDVVMKSGLREAFPEYEIDRLAVGIWGEARRQLALSGRTMGSADTD